MELSEAGGGLPRPAPKGAREVRLVGVAGLERDLDQRPVAGAKKRRRRGEANLLHQATVGQSLERQTALQGPGGAADPFGSRTNIG